MQTFLPYPEFARTAVCLDLRRLGKQRVEALQVLRGLTVAGYGWRQHPAVRMWAGDEEALVRYGLEICAAWCATGRVDTCADSMRAGLVAACGIDVVRTQAALSAAAGLPAWLGREDVHLSHRSALLRKDPDHYRPLFGDEPADLPYVWPGRTAIADVTATGSEHDGAGRASGTDITCCGARYGTSATPARGIHYLRPARQIHVGRVQCGDLRERNRWPSSGTGCAAP
jgi:hypothetical protein